MGGEQSLTRSKASKVVCVFGTLSVLAATMPSDDPTLKPGLDPASVTPGTLGFLSTLFIVVLVILLIRDMTRRVRRVRYTAEVRQAQVRQSTNGSPPVGAGETRDPLPGVDFADHPVAGGEPGSASTKPGTRKGDFSSS